VKIWGFALASQLQILRSRFSCPVIYAHGPATIYGSVCCTVSRGGSKFTQSAVIFAKIFGYYSAAHSAM